MHQRLSPKAEASQKGLIEAKPSLRISVKDERDQAAELWTYPGLQVINGHETQVSSFRVPEMATVKC